MGRRCSHRVSSSLSLVRKLQRSSNREAETGQTRKLPSALWGASRGWDGSGVHPLRFSAQHLELKRDPSPSAGAELLEFRSPQGRGVFSWSRCSRQPWELGLPADRSQSAVVEAESCLATQQVTSFALRGLSGGTDATGCRRKGDSPSWYRFVSKAEWISFTYAFVVGLLSS